MHADALRPVGAHAACLGNEDAGDTMKHTNLYRLTQGTADLRNQESIVCDSIAAALGQRSNSADFWLIERIPGELDDGGFHAYKLLRKPLKVSQ